IQPVAAPGAEAGGITRGPLRNSGDAHHPPQNPYRMAEPLAGKVALVTGAARGIGRATARKLAAAGCDVAVNYYNSADEAASLCEEIRSLGRRACALQASVGI